MGYSNVINDTVSFIHSAEERKKFLSQRLLPLKNVPLGFSSREILEERLVFAVKPANLDFRVCGIDSGFMDRKLSSADIVLVRAVGVCFDFEGSKIKSAQYFPSIYNFPVPHLSVGSFDLAESDYSRSMIRLREEILAAKNCIEKFSPKYCFLDGSIIPQYASPPSSDSKLEGLYHSIIGEFQSLYQLAEDKGCVLVGCVEDSRGSRFCSLFAREVLAKNPILDPVLLENIFDSSLLDYFLAHGERTLAFSYTSNVSQHAILKDFDKKWSENIYGMYLKPSALDAPLRVEFLGNNGSLTKTADEVGGVVFALSGTHREYAYPSILVEADLRSRLTPQEIEVVFGKIFDKLSRHVKLKMRRDKRPF